MSRKRRSKSGGANIPPLLPLLPLGKTGERAFFPSDIYIPQILSVSMNAYSEAYKRALTDMKWAIVVPIFRTSGEQSSLKVGTLVHLRNMCMRKEGKISFQAKGIFRVRFTMGGIVDKYAGLPFYRWEKMVEFQISNHEANLEEFHAALEIFHESFENVRQIFDLDSSFGKEEFYQNAYSYMENLESDTVASAVDSVMNLLNQMDAIARDGAPVPLVFLSAGVLQEERVLVRLERVIELLDELLVMYNKEVLDHVEFSEDEEADSEQKIDISEPVSTKEEKEMAERGLEILEDLGVSNEKKYEDFEKYYQKHKKRKKKKK